MKLKKGLTMIISGVIMLLAAAGITVYNTLDSDRAANSSAALAGVIAEALPETPTLSPSKLQPVGPVIQEMATVEIDGANYIGIIEIPALEVTLPVREDWSYEALKTSPCRFSGSYYTNDLVICAHNYASHFNGLRTIDIGEDVYFTAAGGKTYHYVITNREKLEPHESERMITRDGWDLTLFTCYIGGGTRCTLRCTLAND